MYTIEDLRSYAEKKGGTCESEDYENNETSYE